MERPIKNITLPVTGYKVGIFTYYLRGDRIAIEKIMTGSTKFDSKGKVISVDVGYRYDMDDEAVVRGVKFIKDGESELPVEIATIHGLPEEDFEFLRGSLPKEKGSRSKAKQSAASSKPRQEKGE